MPHAHFRQLLNSFIFLLLGQLDISTLLRISQASKSYPSCEFTYPLGSLLNVKSWGLVKDPQVSEFWFIQLFILSPLIKHHQKWNFLTPTGICHVMCIIHSMYSPFPPL